MVTNGSSNTAHTFERIGERSVINPSISMLSNDSDSSAAQFFFVFAKIEMTPTTIAKDYMILPWTQLPLKFCG